MAIFWGSHYLWLCSVNVRHAPVRKIAAIQLPSGGTVSLRLISAVNVHSCKFIVGFFNMIMTSGLKKYNLQKFFK